MDHLRTLVSPTPSGPKMAVSDRVMTLGSCFSDAIGQRLLNYKISCSANPFGTIYNPAAIHKLVQYAIARDLPHPATYLSNGDSYLNYDFHSSYASPEPASLEGMISTAIHETADRLAQCRWLMITYGTAWVYSRRDTLDTVANCHKVPQANFEKKLMNVDQVVDSFSAIYHGLKRISPSLEIILTVSPVRHIKDTIELNSVSKSVLRVACQEIATRHSSVQYFPAFEIMIDDLRDYRFYKRDLIHPSDLAEDYIWEKFTEAYATDDLRSTMSQWDEIQSAMNHRPFQESSPSHQKFLQKTLDKLERISTVLNVQREIDQIRSKLLYRERKADHP